MIKSPTNLTETHSVNVEANPLVSINGDHLHELKDSFSYVSIPIVRSIHIRLSLTRGEAKGVSNREHPVRMTPTTSEFRNLEKSESNSCQETG